MEEQQPAAVDLEAQQPQDGEAVPPGAELHRQLSVHGKEYDALLAKGVPRHMLARAWVVCNGDANDAELYIRSNADQPPEFWAVPPSSDDDEEEDGEGEDRVVPAAGTTAAAAATPTRRAAVAGAMREPRGAAGGRRWSLVRAALLAAADTTAGAILAEEDPLTRAADEHAAAAAAAAAAPLLTPERPATPNPTGTPETPLGTPLTPLDRRQTRSAPMLPMARRPSMPQDLDVSLQAVRTPKGAVATIAADPSNAAPVQFAAEPLFSLLQAEQRGRAGDAGSFLQQLTAGDQVDVNIGSLRSQIVALSATITASQERTAGPTGARGEKKRRLKYSVGDFVEGFSKSARAWSEGQVTAVDTRRKTVTVRYQKPGGADMQKTTAQESPHIRPYIPVPAAHAAAAAAAADAEGDAGGAKAEEEETKPAPAQGKPGERRDVKLSRQADGRFGVAFLRGGAPGGGVGLADTSAEAAAAGMIVGARVMAVNGAEVGFSSDLSYELDGLDRVGAKHVT